MVKEREIGRRHTALSLGIIQTLKTQHLILKHHKE
jgi:hypothetical protein